MIMDTKILIVEDTVLLRDIIKLALDPLALNISMAKDGAIASEMIKKESYHVIILDYHIPHINGLEFLKILQDSPLNKAAKVCMISTELGFDIRMEAKALGAKGFIAKPFAPEKLRNMVTNLLTQ